MAPTFHEVLKLAPPWELPERDPQVATAPGLQDEIESLRELRFVETAFDVMPPKRERAPLTFGIADARHLAGW